MKKKPEKRKILILDDEEKFGKDHCRRLKRLPEVDARFDISALRPKVFVDSLAILTERRKTSDATTECPFDIADVLIIDWDLIDLGETGGTNGESVARIARCFSTCGLILGVNQFGKNPFDLSLRGHPESWADLNIGVDQLENPGLWGGNASGFRPWAWPLVPDACEAQRHRVKELDGVMTQPIFEYLGLTRVIDLLPRSAIEYIASGKPAGDLKKITFKDFVEAATPERERKNAQFTEENDRRIAAARVAKWIERHLMVGQDILVDAPHLSERFPSLLGSKVTNSALLSVCEVGSEAKTPHGFSKIKKHAFMKSKWVSRPVWFWEDVRMEKLIKEVASPWDAKKLEMAFCEDTSRFAQKRNCRPFVADLQSPYVQRFVRGDCRGVDYEPQVRFSL